MEKLGKVVDFINTTFFGLILLDVIMGHGCIRALDSPSRLILAIPVFIYIRRVGLDDDSIWMASALGSFLTGIYAYYQHTVLGMNIAEGFTSHIYFGQIALVLALFSLVGVLKNEKLWVKGVLLVAAGIGFYATLASGSRGGWVAIPTMIILFMSIKTHKPSFGKKILFLGVLIVALYSAYQNPQLPVKPRIDAAVNNVIAYYQEGKVNTSSGFRLEMWKAAWLMTEDSYFLGVGEAQYHSNLERLIKEGKVDKRLDYFSAPHSQYFNSLSEQGVLGLASLLLMLLIPLKTALSKLNSDKKSKFLALYIAILIITYMDFMFTAETLDRHLMVVFYAFILSILTGMLSNQSFKTDYRQKFNTNL